MSLILRDSQDRNLKNVAFSDSTQGVMAASLYIIYIQCIQYIIYKIQNINIVQQVKNIHYKLLV